MAVVQLKDANGNTYYFDVSGSGTQADPYVPLHQSESTEQLLRLILDALTSPAGWDGSLQRVRSTVALESGSNVVGSIGTVQAVTSLGQIAGRDGCMAIQAWDESAWCDAVRSKI